MHADMQKYTKKHEAATSHQIKLTPVTFLNLIETFKEIFNSRASHYQKMKKKYELALTKMQETEDKIVEVQNEMELKSPELIKA